MLFRVRSLGQDGYVNDLELDLHGMGASSDLPYEVDRYFVKSRGWPVSLMRLITTRARPAGVARAAQLMRAAYEGQHPPRAPIQVRRYDSDGDFLVEDGNSTVLNAIASGWPDILCDSHVRPCLNSQAIG
jgi:hypothetical protein